MLDPRAVALQGVGFSTLLVAVQGFGEVAVGRDWVEANARSYGRKRRDYNEVEPGENVDWALRMQIAEEDEILLAVVMAATPMLGVSSWQR